MNIKTTIGYLVILTLSFVLHAMKPAGAYLQAMLPVAMLIYPIFMGTLVKLRLSLKDLLVGIGVSALILVPYGIAFGSQMRNISLSLVF
ncbi:MAG: hypothetical protein AB1442_00890, partial [Nitrospirota bacterium]